MSIQDDVCKGDRVRYARDVIPRLTHPERANRAGTVLSCVGGFADVLWDGEPRAYLVLKAHLEVVREEVHSS